MSEAPEPLTPFWSEEVAQEMAERLRSVGHDLNRILATAPLPSDTIAHLHQILKNKLLGSSIMAGHPVRPADHGLWAIHALLAYAVTADLARPAVHPNQWQAVVPIATASEFMGTAFNVLDDIQDGDQKLPDLTVVLAAPLTVILFLLVNHALTNPDLPAALRLPIQNMFTTTMMTSAGGQYLDSAYESHQTATVEEAQEIVTRKSASLVSVLYRAGGLAGAMTRFSEDDALAISEICAAFGSHLGTRFQLENDLRDAYLATKSDRTLHKKTLPLVFEQQVATDGADLDQQVRIASDTTRILIEVTNSEAQECLQQLVVRFGLSVEWMQWLV